MTGEYEPSPWQWVRDQVELYESSHGTAGTTLDGRPAFPDYADHQAKTDRAIPVFVLEPVILSGR